MRLARYRSDALTRRYLQACLFAIPVIAVGTTSWDVLSSWPSCSLHQAFGAIIQASAVAIFWPESRRNLRVVEARMRSDRQATEWRARGDAAMAAGRLARLEAQQLALDLEEFIEQRDGMGATEVAYVSATLEARHQSLEQVSAYCDSLSAAYEEKYAAYERSFEEYESLRERLIIERISNWWSHRLATRLSSGFTSAAISIAGAARSEYADQWLDQLAGDSASGRPATRLGQIRDSLGFVKAATRMRVSDVSRFAWRPIEWVLRCDSRTRTAITLMVGAQVVYIMKQDGLHGLLTDGWGWCGGCAIALHLFTRWLRKVRGIELATAAAREEQ